MRIRHGDHSACGIAPRAARRDPKNNRWSPTTLGDNRAHERPKGPRRGISASAEKALLWRGDKRCCASEGTLQKELFPTTGRNYARSIRRTNTEESVGGKAPIGSQSCRTKSGDAKRLRKSQKHLTCGRFDHRRVPPGTRAAGFQAIWPVWDDALRAPDGLYSASEDSVIPIALNISNKRSQRDPMR